MAATDITTLSNANKYTLKGHHNWHSMYRTEIRTVDGAREAGLWTEFTHNIISIPIGWAFVSGWYFVTTTFAGGTSVQFKISNSAVLSGAITVANNGLDKGTGSFLGGMDPGSATYILGLAASFAHTAAQTIDMVVAGTMTAGALILCAELAHVSTLVDQQ